MRGGIGPREIGEAIRLLRDARGLKQYQMAERAGITRAMASRYELGRQMPSVETLLAILRALEADLGHLARAMKFRGRERRS